MSCISAVGSNGINKWLPNSLGYLMKGPSRDDRQPFDDHLAIFRLHNSRVSGKACEAELATLVAKLLHIKKFIVHIMNLPVSGGLMPLLHIRDMPTELLTAFSNLEMVTLAGAAICSKKDLSTACVRLELRGVDEAV